jgi:hypothetical protein
MLRIEAERWYGEPHIGIEGWRRGPGGSGVFGSAGIDFRPSRTAERWTHKIPPVVRIETELRYTELHIGIRGWQRERDIQRYAIALRRRSEQHGGRATDDEQQEQEHKSLLDPSVALR